MAGFHQAIHKTCFYRYMRITVDIPDAIYRALKNKAAREGVPLRLIVLRAIQSELEGTEEKIVRKMKVPVIRSKRPGTLNLTNEQIDDLTAFS